MPNTLHDRHERSNPSSFQRLSPRLTRFGGIVRIQQFMIKGGVKRSTLNFLHALTTGAQRKKGITAMAGWEPMKRLLAGIPLVVPFVRVGTSCSATPQERRLRPGTPAAAPQVARPQETVDLKQKPLDRIPVGTVIGRQPPKGWSHLVLLAIP